jgi:DNA-directed RNA polymerase subunit omega
MAELLQLVPNRYKLVQAVAKRARQLTEGATALVECESSNPLTIAIQEIASGVVSVEGKPPEPDEGEGKTGDEKKTEETGQ